MTSNITRPAESLADAVKAIDAICDDLQKRISEAYYTYGVRVDHRVVTTIDILRADLVDSETRRCLRMPKPR